MIAGLLTFAAVLLGLHLASVALVLWRRRRPAGRAEELPFVALLRPVCGLDPFDAETLATSFHQDHPDHEVIFCAASDRDPVLPLVRRLIAAHPQVRARLLVGDDRISGNPKLNNLVKGWNATAADRIAMTDSNVILPPDYLRTLQATWRPDTGMVSSPPAGLRPEGLWGALECAFLNGHQARWQLAADALGAGFAQGKNLFTTRALIDAAGGLPALGRDLAEDIACTKIVRAAGRRVRLVPVPFGQPVGRRSPGAVWARQLRWSRVRRHGFPGLFLLEPLAGPVLPLVAVLIAAPGLALPFAALWYGAEWVMLRAFGWPRGPRDMAAAVLRDLLLPVLWAATFAGRGFEWRGTAMAAD